MVHKIDTKKPTEEDDKWKNITIAYSEAKIMACSAYIFTTKNIKLKCAEIVYQLYINYNYFFFLR